MWNLLPSERLRCWHEFRKSISDKRIEDALKDTVHLWCYAPYVAHYLTTDQIDQWPGPWELIYENYYCDLAKALGMLYTLYLSSHQCEIEIRTYNDPSTMEQYNLVYIDKGKYVLNYIHDEVVNKTHVPNNLKLVARLTTTDLNLEKIK